MLKIAGVKKEKCTKQIQREKGDWKNNASNYGKQKSNNAFGSSSNKCNKVGNKKNNQP